MSEALFSLGEKRVENLRYALLSGSKCQPGALRLHDQAFELWRQNWQKTFEQLKSSSRVCADDFVRQDLISGLFEGEKAVGLLLHTVLDLDLKAVREHSYLASYPREIIESLRSFGSARVLSMEYLTLDYNWRKSQVGVALSEVILGLGARVLQKSGFGSMTVITRNDRNVNNILYGFGARCLAANLSKHNVLVDLVSLDEGATRPGPNPEVNRLVEFFWQKREDYANFADLASQARQKAAA